MENEVIYKITSPKGKVYIGRTKDFMGRMNEHKHIALKHKSDYSLYKAIRKYGWDNFQKEILCEVNKDIAPKLDQRRSASFNQRALFPSPFVNLLD